MKTETGIIVRRKEAPRVALDTNDDIVVHNET